jgi:predicted nucleic-acid-binding protein
MITVDTNVLVRILVDDPGAPEQVRAARELAKSAGTLFVPQIVQVETVWVLESAYGFDKSALLGVLSGLRDHPAIQLEQRERFITSLGDFQAGGADFSDCLILAASRAINTEVHTFDRRFAKLAGAKLVETSR